MQITVRGRASRSLAPQQAVLTLSVGAESSSAREAIDAAGALLRELTAALDDLEAARPRVLLRRAVLPLGTRSWTEWSPDGEPGPRRHAASATVRLWMADIPALSRVVEEWGGREGIEIEGAQWQLAESVERTVSAEVLADAVADAHDRAHQIARASGREASEVLEIADAGLLAGGTDAPALIQARAMSASPSGGSQMGPLELSPEEIEVAVEVHARFEAR